MLKRFEVHGFKQFQHLTLDFANVRDYAFNTECTKNGLVKDAIIYGRNASGKRIWDLPFLTLLPI